MSMNSLHKEFAKVGLPIIRVYMHVAGLEAATIEHVKLLDTSRLIISIHLKFHKQTSNNNHHIDINNKLFQVRK